MGSRYTKVPHSIIRTPLLSSAEKVVWVFIAGHRSGYSYTGQQASESIGISRRTWCRAVETLVSYGLLRVEKGKNGVNSYVAEQPSDDDSVVPKTIKPCAKITQGVSKNGTTTPINREDQREKENDIKEKSAKDIDIETFLAGSWAETMQMNMGIDQAGLRKALKESVAYCVTEGHELTDTNIKHYAYTAIKYHRKDYQRSSAYEWRSKDGKRWYTWGSATYEIPSTAPLRPSMMHQWDYTHGIWKKN